MGLLTSMVSGDAALRANAAAIGGMRQVFITGRYYDSLPMLGVARTNQAFIANILMFLPFYVGPEGFSADRIGIAVTTGSAGNARLGVYAADGASLAPSTLLDDHGEVDITNTGLKEITIAKTYTALAPYYLIWLAVVANATATVRAASQGPSIFGSNGIGESTGLWKSHTYGALPTPAGSVSYNNAVNVPLVTLRKA